jgi:dephospho-CoA kinase
LKVIGLTGGIGSGKSFVAKIASYFFPVLHINTDEMARQQMMKGQISYNRVVEEFSKYSDELLREDGEINRPVLAKIVFNDAGLLNKLNSITHPAVIDGIKEIIREESGYGEYEAVMIESALVFESGIDKICDEVWFVHAPVSTRIRRLKETRGYSDEKISSVLDDQLAEEEFIKRSDRVIENDDGTGVEEMFTVLSDMLLDVTIK